MTSCVRASHTKRCAPCARTTAPRSSDGRSARASTTCRACWTAGSGASSVRIAFVIHRYGPEIVGGSEHHCRLVAERLAAQHNVDVLTTCARDTLTWKNEYAEGADRIRGVTVRRFRNTGMHDSEAFRTSSEWIFNNGHDRTHEVNWLRQLGPWSPGLIEYLRKNQQQYDVVVFFEYRYATTVLGLEICPKRSVLVPTSAVGSGSDDEQPL